MSILTNFSIGAKLRLAFGALFVALTLVGGAGLYQSSRLNDLADDIVTIHVPALTILGRMAAAVERFRQLQAAALVASTAEEIAIVGKRHSDTSPRKEPPTRSA